MLNNSHDQAILDFIAENGSVKEYSLLSYIQERLPSFFDTLGSKPSLFKKHFLLFNRLHKLNHKMLGNGNCLIISTLEIRISPIHDATTEIAHTDTLREFYLNDDNLNLPDEEVESMMKLFWKKYLAIDRKAKSLCILELENESNINKVKLKQKYNQLAKRHHPDKGGDENRFIEIQQAYNDLKSLF